MTSPASPAQSSFPTMPGLGDMPLAQLWRQQLLGMRDQWGWLLAMGIALVLLGGIAIGYSLLATLVAVMWIGIMLAVAGMVEVISAFWARCWRGFFTALFAGLVYLVLGLLMTSHPVGAAAGLTLMVAALFLVGGATRIVVAIMEQFPGRGWVLFNGIITLVLGIMIWRQWPQDTFWVIGLFVGIDLVFSGWSWIMFALGLRSLRPEATA